MRTKVSVFVSIATLFFCNVVMAQDATLDNLLNVKTIKCYLDKGSSADWSKGKLDIEISKYSKSEEASYITFDSIDIKNGMAKLIANMGASDVTVLATSYGMTFIEKTLSGNFNFTTIFPLKEKNSDKYLFVQSRHIYMTFPSEAMPQQYYGTCVILEKYLK